MSVNDPLRKHRKQKKTPKTGIFTLFREQHGRLPTYWPCGGPVYRRHDSYLGFRTELENRVGDAKGKGTKWTPHEAESTDAPIRGALLRSSEEAG
jgi:hypothetical protein